MFIILNLQSQVAQPAQQAEILEVINPVIRKSFQFFEQKFIDSVTVTTCSGYGAAAGHYFSIKLMQNINLMTGGKGQFNSTERYEDDLGALLGTAAGYHFGQYIVRLRHKITDPLFPQLYNLGEAGVCAVKTFCENTTTWISTYTCNKVENFTNRLNAYAQKKNN